jgi:ABC-type antimicrobial peptide transport system permease subunit
LLRLVLAQAGRVVAIGLALGLALALATGHLLASQLFGLSAQDPLLLATASVVLLLVALTAGFIPARRASRIAPMEALRNE